MQKADSLSFTHFGKVLAASAFWAARIYNWPGNPGNLTEVCCWVDEAFRDFEHFRTLLVVPVASATPVTETSHNGFLFFLLVLTIHEDQLVYLSLSLSLALSLWLLVSIIIYVYWIVLHMHVLYFCCEIICIYIHILVRELYAIQKHLPCYFSGIPLHLPE